jgi:hypothetical protein
VALCINQTYTLQAFWTDVIGQIRQDQQVQDCMVLLNWARVASTYGQPTIPLATMGRLGLPLAGDQLVAQ